MNRFFKTPLLFTLMIFSSCFSMDFSKLSDFGHSFKDNFIGENAKVIGGFMAFGAASAIIARELQVTKETNGLEHFQEVGHYAICGSITGLVLALITIKYIKKSPEQMIAKLIAQGGESLVSNIIKNLKNK